MANSLYTKSNHNMFEVSSLIQKAIRRSNKDYACYAANELAPRFRNYLWKRLLCVSAEDCYDLITNKIVALKQADDMQPSSSPKSSIFVAKAVTILLKVVKYGCCDFYVNDFAYPIVYLEDYDNRHMVIPDYVFDCHTHRGKQIGKTKKEFIVAEQSVLTPYKEGEYDKYSWDRYFYLEKNGFYDKNNITPRPDDNRNEENIFNLCTICFISWMHHTASSTYNFQKRIKGKSLHKTISRS